MNANELRHALGPQNTGAGDEAFASSVVQAHGVWIGSWPILGTLSHTDPKTYRNQDTKPQIGIGIGVSPACGVVIHAADPESSDRIWNQVWGLCLDIPGHAKAARKGEQILPVRTSLETSPEEILEERKKFDREPPREQANNRRHSADVLDRILARRPGEGSRNAYLRSIDAGLRAAYENTLPHHSDEKATVYCLIVNMIRKGTERTGLREHLDKWTPTQRKQAATLAITLLREHARVTDDKEIIWLIQNA